MLTPEDPDRDLHVNYSIDERSWWEGEHWDWTEDLYYDTLAAHFQEKYEQLTSRMRLDCE